MFPASGNFEKTPYGISSIKLDVAVIHGAVIIPEHIAVKVDVFIFFSIIF